MSLHRLCAKLRRPSHHTHLPRFLRRMLVSSDDTISMQLVHKRGAGYSNRISLHSISALGSFRWPYRIWHPLHERSSWVVRMEVVSRRHRTFQGPCSTNKLFRLYVIEGIITVIWAFCCIFLVPKSFETAYFLNDEEKTLMRQRAHRTQAYSDSEGSGHYGKADIKEAAKDIKSWVHGLIQIAVVTILYGFGTFLPIIIRNGFNFSTKQVCLSALYLSTQRSHG